MSDKCFIRWRSSASFRAHLMVICFPRELGALKFRLGFYMARLYAGLITLMKRTEPTRRNGQSNTYG